MLTFRRFLYENALFQRLLPAVHHIPTGKMFIGKRGESHEEIRDRHIAEMPDKRQYGYHDPQTRKFHPRGSKEVKNIDTTSLMSPVQRMRKFGTEECQKH